MWVFMSIVLPIGSALVSLAAYSLLFNWQFGVGLVTLLFIHEMGHYVIIRAKGLPANWPVFIPLLGAYVAMRRMPLNARDEAEIAIAGPLAGAAAGVVCLFLYQQTQLAVLVPLTYLNFLINLINLIPVAPLDGGRVVGAISRWIWPLGLIGAVAGLIYTHNLLLILLIWIGLSETVARFRLSNRSAYYQVPLLVRVYFTALYLGLAAVLTFGMLFSQEMFVALRGPLF